jgi:hypothetical protein
VFNGNLISQTINIDSTFTADAEIFPFSPDDTITGLSISGSIELNSDTSLVRVILVDEDYNEYMVYEAYPMIVTDTAFDIIEGCDETCYLDEIPSSSIIIHLYDASITVDSLNCSFQYQANLDQLQYEAKRSKDAEKIDNMNLYIQNKGWQWYADSTTFVQHYYTAKKDYFGTKYNMLGIDYYIGGVYNNVHIEQIPLFDDGNFIFSFDWRDKHDATIDTSSYYDTDPDIDQLNGWMTGIRDQDICNSCTPFAAIGVLEGFVNLYYNYHIDVDSSLRLSEKDAWNCSFYPPAQTGCSCAFGKTVPDVLEYIEEVGVVDEQCFRYLEPYCLGSGANCEFAYGPEDWEKCSDPDYLTYATSEELDFENTPPELTSQEYLKTMLMEKGPLLIVVDNLYHPSLPHAVTLVGFDKDDEGKTIWIMKNSWGINYPNPDPFQTPVGWDQGYVTSSLICGHHNNAPCIEDEFYAYLSTEINGNPIYPDFSVQIRDDDMDGYFNWGIGDIPAGWVPPCNPNKDWNDNNNRIGPAIDDDYNIATVQPLMEVYLGHPDFGGVKLDNNEFVYFSDNDLQDDELHFYIKNSGDAYINLNGDNPIIEIQPFGDCFVLYDALVDTQICWDPSNNFTRFEIEFKSECQISYDTPPAAVYEIDVHSNDEDVLEDFKFSLVYYDCGVTDGTYEIPVDVTEVWADHRVVTKNVKIRTGAKLEISGWVEFTKDCEIWVEPGGELLIDGGVLSGACDEFWNGIDVWGDAEESQYEDDQGEVKIKNGGTIMHANCGIETGRFVPGYYIPSGGIVSSNGAIFKDNIIGVRFHPYHNFHPQTGDPTGNICRFRNTSFVTSQGIYDMGEEPESFVDLNWVEGILFKGNTYKNEAVTTSGEHRGIGSKGATAGFYVYNECADPASNPCSEYLISSFEHLDYGIKVFGERESLPIVIDSAVFHDNLRGIFISGMNGFEIYHNSFEMDVLNSAHETNDTLCGIYLEACRDFLLTENYVKGYSGTQMKHAGVYVSNLGPYYNEIYNNSIENISCGIVAAGENRNGEADGLCILCNDFVDCQYDVYVIPYGGVNVNRLGIALNQGDYGSQAPPGVSPNAMAAGNTFTSDDYGDLEYNYYNHPNLNWIQYIHHQEQLIVKLKPDPYNRVYRDEDINVSYSKDTSCPTVLYCGIDSQVEKGILSNESIQIAAYHDTLAQFIDGGDTEDLTFEVQTSIPDEALQVRQELLNESPYLSDTVMKSAIIKENVLPNAMVRDVLVANPQSAKSANVVSALDQRFEPMPDYMMAEIMNGLNSNGAKEILEQKLARHSSFRGKSFAKLYRHYNNDTINLWAGDSLLALLQNEQVPDRHYQVALKYLSEDDSLQVMNTLNSIPVEFDLDDDQQIQHDLYQDLFGILLESKSNRVGLDSLQIAILLNISQNQNKLPAICARNFLIANGVINFVEPIYLPGNLKNTPGWDYYDPVFYESSLFKVFPNPSKSYFIIEYDIRKFEGNALFRVSDISGKHFSTIPIGDKQNQHVVSTSGYPVGVYIIQLFINSNLEESKKINISY